jgi:hypothetical protein
LSLRQQRGVSCDNGGFVSRQKCRGCYVGVVWDPRTWFRIVGRGPIKQETSAPALKLDRFDPNYLAILGINIMGPAAARRDNAAVLLKRPRRSPISTGELIIRTTR